jgi:solute:Na+ symporter, SSS family
MNPAAVVIVIYLLAMLAIGTWGLRLKGLEDFHLAGRSIKLVLLTGTFCATIIGASSTLGMAGLGFSGGLPGAWWMLSGTAGLLVLAAFFAEKVRATGCCTLPEIVGSFYGERARFVASALIVISWVGVIAVQIVACSKVLGAVFGGNETLFMAACTAVFVLYTVHGGQSSVIRTDLVQLMIILAGMVVLFSKALEAAGPGLISSQSFPTSPEMGGWDVLSMLLVVGSAYLVGPDMYSRLLSAHSPRDAKISAAISAVILIPMAFLITSLGIFARSLYPAASPEQAIPVLLTGLLSPGFEGLVAAALLAAFMSSADTSLMTATSILTLDIYKKASPGSSEKKLMTMSRLFVLIIGFSALALAVSLPSIIKTLLIAYTVFTSGLLLPVIAGFFKERLGLTPSGALAALLGGGVTAIFLGQRYPLLGMAVSGAFLFGVSWLERQYTEQECKSRN